MTTKMLITSDDPKGQQAVALFRAAYNKVELDEVRAQALNENRAFAAALRRVIAEHSMPVAAPKGGRIHIVRVPFNPGREWQEAIDASGPNTGKDWDIRKIGDKYPPQAGKTIEREIILVNFGKTIPDTQHALDWAKPYGLQPEPPRGVFAIGEHKPNLNKELGMDYMGVVSPVECSFGGDRQVPCEWWDGSGRSVGLDWFGGDWDGSYWFAFSRES
ncbi:MAG: hypothetical protein WA021_04340 [Minisyncoccia bacterium]